MIGVAYTKSTLVALELAVGSVTGEFHLGRGDVTESFSEA
jgi:hypothetical protein